MIVAQLSDIHADGSAERLNRLDRVMNWLRPLRPDAVIVSGDLAEDAFAESYGEIKERLESLRCPYLVVPGNVDDHQKMRRAFGERFDWTNDRPLNVSDTVAGIRMIGLDVTVEGAHHGDAAPVLDWLATELAASAVPTMIFQHQHPFLTGIDGKDKNVCLNGDRLAGVIAAAGDTVVALTCGHVHRALFSCFAGRQATMAPSVSRANRLRLDGRESDIADPPGLLLHHFSNGQMVTHVVSVS